MKKTILFLVAALFSAVTMAQEYSIESESQNPVRGGGPSCSGTVVTGSSATITLCVEDYDPEVLNSTPYLFNVVLPSGIYYSINGLAKLENVHYADSLVLKEVDATGNTIARLAKFTGNMNYNVNVNIPSQSTTGRFVFEVYCYYGANNSSCGFSFTISPSQQTELGYACATYLGVGTCSPQKTLHVNGVFRVSNPESPSSYFNIQPSSSAINFQSSTLPFYFNRKVIADYGFYSSNNYDLTLGTGTNTARMTILKSNGNVGIGTTAPSYKLDVLGTIHASEVLVSIPNGADFVFDNNYHLMPLEQLSEYVQQNKHLPEIKSAEQMKQEGVTMGEMQILLLQKIEELTLYIIKQEERIKELELKDKK